jgi:hypothetical protein
VTTATFFSALIAESALSGSKFHTHSDRTTFASQLTEAAGVATELPDMMAQTRLDIPWLVEAQIHEFLDARLRAGLASEVMHASHSG